MDIAFVIYDGMTALDFVGFFDPVTRLGTMGYREDLEWDVCARAETASATGGLTFEADRLEPDLGGYDLAYFPGGVETRELADDEGFVEWVRTAAGCEYLVSVCTGSLLLGAAGFLDGRSATTHPTAYDRLEEFCTVRDERVVDEGDVITGRGVSSSVDLGLHLVERLSDADTRREIAEQMDYPYDAVDPTAIATGS